MLIEVIVKENYLVYKIVDFKTLEVSFRAIDLF